MTHQPIQFGEGAGGACGGASEGVSGEVSGGGWDASLRPVGLDLKKDTALTVRWSDGRVSVYPVKYLRRMSPSAEARTLREEQARNPLTVLPSSATSGASGGGGGGGGLVAEGAELVGHYAVRISFSDGHHTGLYTWRYLREIDPAAGAEGQPVDPDRGVWP